MLFLPALKTRRNNCTRTCLYFQQIKSGALVALLFFCLSFFEGVDMETFRWQTLGSTNTQAKELIAQGRVTPALLVAESQTLGRGQQERSFSSPQGGLYFTILDHAALPGYLLPCVTLAVGVACAEIVEETGQVDVLLKWPNDLYVEGRKIGGILCESTSQPDGTVWILIGVGINVNSSVSQFPEEIRSASTTLLEKTGKIFDLQSVLLKLVENIQRKIFLLGSDTELLLAQWQKRDYLYGRKLFYDNGRTQRAAKGMGMTNQGRYMIQYPDGMQEQVLSGRLQPSVL